MEHQALESSIRLAVDRRNEHPLLGGRLGVHVMASGSPRSGPTSSVARPTSSFDIVIRQS
jgi:hypothetical protein